MALPADTALTLSQLNILFQELTLDMLGYGVQLAAWKAYLADPVHITKPSTNPYEIVRVFWPTQGQPAWKITDDITFVRIVEEGGDFTRDRTQEYEPITISQVEQLDENTTYTRIISVFWNLYGPNSYDYCQKIKDGVFKQENRGTLAGNNLYPIPNVMTPKRFPELFQGQWWERTDLTIAFNEKIVRHQAVLYIESADIEATLDGERFVPAPVTSEIAESFE